mmetsp:Transcript_14073/g.25771  ORF Transcript_14073/g.25771 Transcript_14073/m.25771 type:complete len:213 (-) Transcript_14073:684-1322(-)
MVFFKSVMATRCSSLVLSRAFDRRETSAFVFSSLRVRSALATFASASSFSRLRALLLYSFACLSSLAFSSSDSDAELLYISCLSARPALRAARASFSRAMRWQSDLAASHSRLRRETLLACSTARRFLASSSRRFSFSSFSICCCKMVSCSLASLLALSSPVTTARLAFCSSVPSDIECSSASAFARLRASMLFWSSSRSSSKILLDLATSD